MLKRNERQFELTLETLSLSLSRGGEWSGRKRGEIQTAASWLQVEISKDAQKIAEKEKKKKMLMKRSDVVFVFVAWLDTANLSLLVFFLGAEIPKDGLNNRRKI